MKSRNSKAELMAKVPKYTDVVKELGNQGGEAEMA
jgi:hypothetical protein